jgi:hypothetical protein
MGKGGRCVRLSNLPPLSADCMEILGALFSWNPEAQYRDCFTNIYEMDLCIEMNRDMA